MRYRVQVAGWALIWSGLLVFGYIGWQIYITDLINARVQAEAAEGLRSGLSASDPDADSIDSGEFLGSDLPAGFPAFVDYYSEEAVAHGEPFAFITIPAIGLDSVVVYEGVDRETLKNGPGHMESTPLPGQVGNAVLSGHRTTYGRPFFDFDLLESGDRVEVEAGTGVHVYEVRESRVVDPTDVWVTDPRPGGWLTLTTCEPKFSARQRLVVWAEMVDGPNHDWIELNEIRSGAS
jgi:sortase A